MSLKMDESVIRLIDMLAQKLGISKKAVLENAVRYYAEMIESERDFDVFTHTFGSWRREESAAGTVDAVKNAMRQSLERYKP